MKKNIRIVIYIFAIILLISLVLLIINLNKKNKNLSLESGKNYVESIEERMRQQQLGRIDTNIVDGKYTVNKLKEYGIELQKNQKLDGTVLVDNYKVTWAELVFKNIVITYSYGNYNISNKKGYRVNYTLDNGKKINCNPLGIGEIYAVYFNPETGTKCDIDEYHDNYNNYRDFSKFIDGDVTELTTGCLKWYPYDKTEEDTLLILDHNVSRESSYDNAVVNLNNSIKKWNDYSARLLKKEELEKIIGNNIVVNNYLDSCANEAKILLGNDTSSINEYTKDNISIYQWLFNYTFCKDYGCRETSYATVGYWIDSENETLFVSNDGKVKNEQGNDIVGIRPVISVNTKLLEE